MNTLLSITLNVRLLLIGALSLIGATATADPYDAYKASPSAETAFDYLHQVATHPRCANCHGKVEAGVHFPTVGDERRRHPMQISFRNNVRLVAGPDGFDQVETTQPVTCRSCHRNSNMEGEGTPPGAANDLMPGFIWHMPPPTMIIDPDVSPRQLCEDWLNPAKNSFLATRGGRDDMETFKKEFIHHAQDDPLVRWSWEPGDDRTPAPGSHADFSAAMKTWVSAGAPCPDA